MKQVLVIINDDAMLAALAEFEVVVSDKGLDYFMSFSNYRDYLGVVTVDVAKQYTVPEVRMMLKILQADPTKIYLDYQPD